MNPHDPMIETNDPRLTAYVLGELAPNEIAQIEDALKSSPPLRAAVADIRRATESITSVFQAEPSLQLAPEQRIKLLDEAESVSEAGSAANTDVHSFADNVTPTVTGEHYQPSAGSTAHWLKIAVAAGLAGLLLGGAYYFTETERLPIAASDRPTLDADVQLEESEIKSGSLGSSQEQLHFITENKDTELPLAASPINESRAPTRNRGTDWNSNAIPPTANNGVRANNSVTKKQDFYAPNALPNSDISRLALPDSKATLPSRDDLPKAKPRSKSKSNDSDRFPAKMEAAAQSNNNNRSSQLPKVESPLPQKPSVAKAASEQFDLKLSQNAATQLRAQQSLDQSTLGSLNLRVVALDRPIQFQRSTGGEGHGGGGFSDRADTEEIQANQKLSKNKTTQPDATQSLPTTFELRISDQDALRMVRLLASQADPLQQRKLSFDELIGLQKSPQDADDTVAGKVELLDDYGDYSDGEGNDALKSEADAAPLGDRKLLDQSKPQAAVMMLASKLREHAGRPSMRFNNGRSLQRVEDLSTDGVTADSNKDSLSLRPTTPGGSTAGNPLIAPGQDAKPKFRASEPIEGTEFNFDYTQIIQQLKTNLEIRNQSVVSPQHSPARAAP